MIQDFCGLSCCSLHFQINLSLLASDTNKLNKGGAEGVFKCLARNNIMHLQRKSCSLPGKLCLKLTCGGQSPGHR